MSQYVYKQLKPESLWFFFNELNQIPRPSKHEQQVTQYLLRFAAERGLEVKKDNADNVLITKPATKGYEKAPVVTLQSHTDMVCEKNADTTHNFATDPIRTYIKDGWVYAQGTTLGADNGIGVAAMLAVLDAKNLEHPTIECIFTTDEETGLTGANALSSNFLKGSIMLNLDSEDEGQFFVGCAGGIDTIAQFTPRFQPTPKEYVGYKISVSGLQGGHSGGDIHRGLGNAVKLAIRILAAAATKKISLRLAQFTGGNLRNAIAREAVATVAVSPKQEQKFINWFKTISSEIAREYRVTEPALHITAEAQNVEPLVTTSAWQKKFVNALNGCWHGVYAWSADIPGMVETSTNLASVKWSDTVVTVATSQRSTFDSAKRDVASVVRSVFELAGAKIRNTDGYPGWQPNPNSHIVPIIVKEYQDIFKAPATVCTIHAGLECGLFSLKYPDMDMVSFGPNIRGAHSPDERVEIQSVANFWKLLVNVLERIR